MKTCDWGVGVWTAADRRPCREPAPAILAVHRAEEPQRVRVVRACPTHLAAIVAATAPYQAPARGQRGKGKVKR